MSGQIVVMDRTDINSPHLPNLFDHWLVVWGMSPEEARRVDRIELAGVIVEAVDENGDIISEPGGVASGPIGK